MLRVGSTFSGVGGADIGLERAGMQLAWTCEIDKWKRSILQAHWPNIPHHDDIQQLFNPEPVQLLVGGFPCQDLSVAGKRQGFAGHRSVLAFEFLRLAESLRPRWLILENVPGLLSSNRGADFARLINEVVGCGYGVAWRILDARYFGVPQRRRRVFIVARRADASGDFRAAAELALRAVWQSGGGDSTPGWPPRQETAGGVGAGVASSSGQPIAFSHTQGLHEQASTKHFPTLRKNGNGQSVAYRKSKRARTQQDDETWLEDGAANTLNAFDVGDTRTTHVVVPFNAEFSNGALPGGKVMHTLCKNATAAVAEKMSVRRLTPIECERLMGWPDNWTAPPGIKASDSKRYAACGDGIVSWVAYWIGCRIQMIENETTT